jgi:tryptophan-rich sensory protein
LPLVNILLAKTGFNAKSEGLGRFSDGTFVLTLSAATMVAAWRIRPLAGGVLPYLGWVALARAQKLVPRRR